MIDQLKSEISRRGGLARPNRFKVIISPPSGTSIAETLSLLCESTSIPGRQITSFEYPLFVYRHQVKVPNGYLNEDINMNFILTNDHIANRFFQEWSSLVMNRNSYTINYTQQYAGTIEMISLDETDLNVQSVKLYNAWPLSINSIEMNHSSTDDYMRLPVTITYEDFEINFSSSDIGVTRGDSEFIVNQTTQQYARPQTDPALARFSGGFGTF